MTLTKMYICVALIYPQVTLATTHYMTVSCSWKQYYYIFYKRKTCLVGDLNSRTADYDDFITDDSVHSSLQDRLNNLFTYTNDLRLSKRMNPDKSRNEYGSIVIFVGLLLLLVIFVGLLLLLVIFVGLLLLLLLYL